MIGLKNAAAAPIELTIAIAESAPAPANTLDTNGMKRLPLWPAIETRARASSSRLGSPATVVHTQPTPPRIVLPATSTPLLPVRPAIHERANAKQTPISVGTPESNAD